MSNKVELQGTVVQIEEKSGETTKGTWKRQNIVIKTNAEYKNTIPVGFFNKDLDVKEGDNVTVTAFVGGREYEGRYFLDIDGDTLTVTGKAMTTKEVYTTQPEAVAVEEDDSDGLPF